MHKKLNDKIYENKIRISIIQLIIHLLSLVKCTKIKNLDNKIIKVEDKI